MMEYKIMGKLVFGVNVFIQFVSFWILPNISCLPVVPQSAQIHLTADVYLTDDVSPHKLQDNPSKSTQHNIALSNVQYQTYEPISGHSQQEEENFIAKQNGAQFLLTRHSKTQNASKPLKYSTDYNKVQSDNSEVFKIIHREHEHSKNFHVDRSNINGANPFLPNSQQSQTENATTNVDSKLTAEIPNKILENDKSLQLAVKADVPGQGEGQTEVHDVMLMVGTALAALFSVGVIIGIFSCCCKKKLQTEDSSKEENGKMAPQNGQQDKDEGLQVKDERSLANNQKPSQIFNTSDIPTGEKDLDEVSFGDIKEKIKALEGSKLIIQPSPDKRLSQLAVEQQTKRLSQFTPEKQANQKSQISPDQAGNQRNSYIIDSTFENSGTVQIRMTKQPQILVSDEVEANRDKEETRDKTDKSKSTGDVISKSDTQDDISDKIFDNVSMNSSISIPNNPDVVIADSDEDEDFAELQRGTVILKSFQRAKPPRNRSPATRTSKGKIRKPRPNAGTPRNQSSKQEVATEKETVSTPSGSLTTTPGTSDKTNILDKTESKENKTPSKSNSLEKSSEKDHNNGKPSVSEMSKSMDYSEFDSVMSKSVTSIGSDIVTPMKRERNGKYAKGKDSPKGERKESPARFAKTDKDVSEKEKRTESPSRYKKNSPVNKRKHRKRENDKEQNRLSTDITEDKPVENPSVTNRLSGLPANASNNIFFLIDPTVKNRYKSAGDIADDKRKSGDYGIKAKKKTGNDDPKETSPVKRERTYSDPNRKSAEIESSHV